MNASQFRRIDEACDTFEAAWLAGSRPSVEDHLARAAPEDQAALLSHLMRLDVEYRRKAGETPRLDEYQARFPTHADRLPALTPDAREPSTPDLPGYEILSELGRGGMGIVYKARDVRLGRIVAVKVLAAQLAAVPIARRRFFREARAAAAVRHDHVVTIHYVSDEGAEPPFLVMEFIAGKSLDDLVRSRGALEVEQVVRVAAQIAEGLAAAHGHDLIHRDVKPANVLLEDGVSPRPASGRGVGGEGFPRVKIADFGLARAAGDESMTQTGVLAGTPLFMSPEQVRGEEPDARSDLFSLGGTLYFLCTGTPPFTGGNAAAVMERVRECRPRPVREINADVPDWLAAVVHRLLEKDPSARFQSAAELAELLRRRLEGEKQPAPATASRTDAAVPAPRKRKRWRAAVVLLGLAAFVAGLGVATVVWRPKVTDKRPSDSPAVEGSEDDGGKPSPRVLTVSKKPDDLADHSTISAALEKVKPKMTIRVLDDADYDEFLTLDKPERHRGVVLEAVGKVPARLRPPRDVRGMVIVQIANVPGVTLRGFRLESGGVPHDQVNVKGASAGVILERLDMTSGFGCIGLREVQLPDDAAPIVIRDCTIRKGAYYGVHVQGFDRENGRSSPCGHLLVRDNTFVGAIETVVLLGEIHKVHVIGNRFIEARFGVGLFDPLPGTSDVLVANNTFYQNQTPLAIWDESKKKGFQKCEGVRFQNNLVLEPRFPSDLILLDHVRWNYDESWPGALDQLPAIPQFRISHNWREVNAEKAAMPHERFLWMPAQPGDRLQSPLAAGLLSRTRGEEDFLRPARGSPLGWSGAGSRRMVLASAASAVGLGDGPNALLSAWTAHTGAAGFDPALPPYLGALPPRGERAWDWDATWKAKGKR
jgi:serine/threonine protein kinase